MCRSEDCVYVAVATSENDILLKLSDEGKLLWAKELKFKNKEWGADLTAVAYDGRYVFVGGNFLAKIGPSDGEILWVSVHFHSSMISRFSETMSTSSITITISSSLTLKVISYRLRGLREMTTTFI